MHAPREIVDRAVLSLNDAAMSVASTLAPSAAKASAAARPIPCAAAVTKARLPSSLPVMPPRHAILAGGSSRGPGQARRAPNCHAAEAPVNDMPIRQPAVLPLTPALSPQAGRGRAAFPSE